MLKDKLTDREIDELVSRLEERISLERIARGLHHDQDLFLAYLNLFRADLHGTANTNNDILQWKAANTRWERAAFTTTFPRASARAYNNADISVPNNVKTVLNFNSTRFDTNTMHNNVTNNSRLTCNTAGKYMLGVQMFYQPNATGIRQVEIRLNGTTMIVGTGENALSSDVSITSCAGLYQLAVNDYVEALALQTSGGALLISFVNGTSPEFWAALVDV